MATVKYFNLNDFKKTDYKYPRGVAPNCRYVKHMDKEYGRIRFRLPNEIRFLINRLPKEVSGGVRKRDGVLRELEKLLKVGYFPKNAIKKLPLAKDSRNEKKKVSIQDAISLYYTQYNSKKWQKSEKTIKNESPTLHHLTTHFTNKGRRYISDITTKDLIDFNADIKSFTDRQTGIPIKNTTQATYKKILKAFLCCLKRPLELTLDPSELDTNVYTKGKIDKDAGARTICIPPELLDLVDKCNYKTSANYPCRKELVHLLRKTGLCKAELASLSTHNLHPNVEDFDSIKIMDKEDCPMLHSIGFGVKTINRVRRIKLDQRCINFLKSQYKKHKQHNVYGKHYEVDTNRKRKVTYIKYPFLLSIERDKKWQRCDDFIIGIQSLLAQTNKEFELNIKEKFTVHDFRTTFNTEWGDKGMSDTSRAYLLGHDVKVNRRNYLNCKKRKEIEMNRAFAEMNHLEETA